MSDTALRRFLLLSASAVMACALFFLCFRYLLWWLLPFLLAFGIAHLCEPIEAYLQRRFCFRRSFCALLLTLMLLFLLGGLLSLLATTLVGEAHSLLERTPQLLESIPALFDTLLMQLESSSFPAWLRTTLQGALTQAANDTGVLLSALSGKLLGILSSFASRIPHVILAIATTVLAIYFTLFAYPTLCSFLRTRLDERQRTSLRALRSGFTHSLASWLKAELTLMLVTFCELLIGFALMRQDYALLLSLLIAVLDALPVFGTGTILLPWALWLLVQQRAARALSLLALYLTTLLVRNILEPKLLASRAGLPAVVSLFTMYLGFCTFGVGGMVLFPLILLLTVQVIQIGKEKQGKSF